MKESNTLTTAERPLPDDVAEVSERTKVGMGGPLPMKTHEYRGESTLFSPAVWGDGRGTDVSVGVPYQGSAARPRTTL